MKNLAKQFLPLSKRGSVLIMVVVIIVVMALLGATYLQVARVQRVSVSESRVQKHIDEVAIAAMEQIAGAMRDDLIKDGNNDPNFEMYDYAWTNYRSSRQIDTMFSSNVTVAGGQGDDMWLAATMPEFSSETDGGTWRKITNLQGFFIGASGGNANLEDIGDIPTGANEYPVESDGTTYSSNVANRDTDIPLSSNVLVDADGDGIGDSRWTWAPYPVVDGRIYTMAVRIVDLASLINLNTSPHYAVNNDDDTNPLWASPAAWWPSWRFQTTGKSEPTREERMLDWERVGRYEPIDGVPEGYNGRTALYSLADEYELRHRNGLNNATTDATVELDFATQLRSGALEDLYEDVTGTGSNAVSRFFNFNQETGGSDNIQLGVWEHRKVFTGLSGTNILAAPLPGDNFSVTYDGTNGFGEAMPGTNVQVDLNFAATTTIASRIREVYSNNTPATLPAGFTDLDEFANAFAASIVDFGDRKEPAFGTGPDRDWQPDAEVEVTQVGDWYGFEYVPMLTEVYIQGPYQIKTTNDAPFVRDDNDTPTDYTDDTWQVDWELITGAQPGFAIEITNPYDVAIPLRGISLWFGPTRVSDGAASADLEDLAGSELTAANSIVPTNYRQFLQPGQKLVLYKDSSGGNDDEISSLIDTSGSVNTPGGYSVPKVVAVELANEDTSVLVSGGGPGTVQVQLRANVFNSGTPSPAFSQLSVPSLPQEFTNEDFQYESGDTNYGTNVAPVLPEPRIDYYQANTQGGNDGLGMLAVTDANSHRAEIRPDGTLGRSTTLHRLGSGSKQTSSQPSVAANTQVLVHNHYTGKMLHPGELALVQIFSFGGPSSQTIPQRLAPVVSGSFDVDDFRVDLSGDNVINSSDPNYNLPHAAFLIDQFTTLHPGFDGVDNDNADGDDNDTTGNNNEIFVPGRININTMPESYLRFALPLFNSEVRRDLAREIVDFRENPRRGHSTTWGNAANSNVQGIAYIGELFEEGLEPQMTDLFHPGGVEGSDNIEVAGQLFDLLGNPLDASGNPQLDGAVDDREERLIVPRWLTAAATTRSDVFVAFVLVQGWEVSDFSVGPRESKQYIAIFRRYVAEDGSVTVKALLPGNQVYTIN